MVAREVVWAIICVGSVDRASIKSLYKEAGLPWLAENFLRKIG
jgi:hypothetical protein